MACRFANARVLSKITSTSILVLCALAIALPVNGPLAHDGATGIVKERQDAMKSMGRALKALKTALNAGQIPDRAGLQAISDQPRQTRRRATSGSFPEGRAAT
jgi:hypothetical protein